MARKQTKKAGNEELRAIDLCSGPGGVTTGYRAAGIGVLAAVDIDPRARESYAANHPDIRLLGTDLLDLNPEELLQRLRLKPGELDVLTACVPCQTFSTLGRRNLKKNDPRNRLVWRVGTFAEVLKPRAVVMENVPPLADDIRFRRLVGRLKRQGYGLWYDVVDAANFGVPQRRRRLVMIALRGKRDEDVPALRPEHPALRAFREKRVVRDAFGELIGREGDPLAEPRTSYPPLVARRIAAIPKDGGSRKSLPAELELQCHTNGRRSAASNVYGRMKLDEIAPTLTTRCTSPSCGRFLHPTEDRAITLREAAVLQTFPIDYIFVGGTMSIQMQIGNAVPPRLAEAIAVLLRHALGQ